MRERNSAGWLEGGQAAAGLLLIGSTASSPLALIADRLTATATIQDALTLPQTLLSIRQPSSLLPFPACLSVPTVADFSRLIGCVNVIVCKRCDINASQCQMVVVSHSAGLPALRGSCCCSVGQHCRLSKQKSAAALTAAGSRAQLTATGLAASPFTSSCKRGGEQAHRTSVHVCPFSVDGLAATEKAAEQALL